MRAHFTQRALLLSTLAILPWTAHAATPQYALSLYGDIKYPENFTHFDYVNPDAPKGGTLRLSAIGTFDNLNPYIIKGNAANGVDSLTNPTLMVQAYDEPFTLYGYVAQSVNLADDRSSITFNLNPNAKWDDGEPLTAHDVEWTFNTLVKDGTPFYRAYYADVTKVTATDDLHVTFNFASKNNRELPLIVAQLPILPERVHIFTASSKEPRYKSFRSLHFSHKAI